MSNAAHRTQSAAGVIETEPSSSPSEFDEVGRDSRPLKPPEQKRRRILNAAALLFAEQGFDGTRVEQISKRAGVSKGLVYVHFPSKEALLEAVLSIAITEWAEAASRSSSQPGLSTQERIVALLRSSIDHAERRPILRTLLAQDPRGLLPGELNHIDRLVAAYTLGVEGLLRRGIECGDLRANLDASYAAKALWVLHFALMRELFIAPTTSAGADTDRLASVAIDMILHGFVA